MPVIDKRGLNFNPIAQRHSINPGFNVVLDDYLNRFGCHDELVNPYGSMHLTSWVASALAEEANSQ
jgi:hypothetical protein